MKKWIIYSFLALICSNNLFAIGIKTERWQTSNGVEVVFHSAMEVPMLSIHMAFRAGSAYDGKHFGLSSLTTQLLNQGNGSLTANQIAEKLANTGAQYGSSVSRDMAALTLKTLTSDPALNDAVNAFSLIVGKPFFPTEAFVREKNRQLLSIKHSEESPSDLANQQFFNGLYHQHPYAHPVDGTAPSVKALTRNQVFEFYKRYFIANNAVLVLVGAIDSEKAHEIAETISQGLKKGEPVAELPLAPPLVDAEKISTPYPSSQTMLRLGQIGIDYSDPSYFPLQVGNYILGGGVLVSRLSLEVREKRGLTYGIVSQFIPMPGKGPFVISLSTKNSQAAQALKITERVLNNFMTHGPTEEELTAAKQYIVGNFPLNLASNNGIAQMLLRIAFYHLPENYIETYTANIEAVTNEDIKNAFVEHLQPSKMLLVSVGQR